MKTAEVRILPADYSDPSIDEDNFLLVETMASPTGEETNIEQFRRDRTGESEDLSKDSVATSLTSTHKIALEWAVAFAALNEIPVVYERRKNDAPVECERRKIDTLVED